jgi:hypothetical protein
MAVRRAPAGLGKSAGKFWADTTKVYDLSAHEALILESACRELDIIDRLEEALNGADLVVRGSMGQDVAHPLLAEVRQHRSSFTALVKALKLPDAEDEAPMSPRSMQAQAAANARWSRGA